MPPFDNDLGPVALPGEAVRLEPDGATYEVTAVEQMAKIGPIDYGSATAGGTATESGSNIINLDDELEMNDGVLGQFWVNPLSDVEVEVRQQGEQEQRFVNANQVGVITPNTPPQQRVVFVWESDAPHAIITNPTTVAMDKTLVYYTGWKLVTGSVLSDAEVDEMRGTPASVPVDSLKKTVRG